MHMGQKNYFFNSRNPFFSNLFWFDYGTTMVNKYGIFCCQTDTFVFRWRSVFVIQSIWNCCFSNLAVCHISFFLEKTKRCLLSMNTADFLMNTDKKTFVASKNSLFLLVLFSCFKLFFKSTFSFSLSL